MRDHHNVPPFITMEFVEGETLSAHRHRAGAMPTAEALSLIEQIARGLEAAHRKGIIHGDFKPGSARIESGINSHMLGRN
jgi:serine/threonine protein kinase